MTMKISDKLTKVDASFTINMYDNGFMVEVDGRDDDQEYMSAKILCNTIDEVVELVKEAAVAERDN